MWYELDICYDICFYFIKKNMILNKNSKRITIRSYLSLTLRHLLLDFLNKGETQT